MTPTDPERTVDTDCLDVGVLASAVTSAFKQRVAEMVINGTLESRFRFIFSFSPPPRYIRVRAISHPARPKFVKIFLWRIAFAYAIFSMRRCWFSRTK